MQELKLVKNLAFGDIARSQILTGVEKLTNAVGSTLGASGKCVILEDGHGNPIITKDGVTVLYAVKAETWSHNKKCRKLYSDVLSILKTLISHFEGSKTAWCRHSNYWTDTQGK